MGGEHEDTIEPESRKPKGVIEADEDDFIGDEAIAHDTNDLPELGPQAQRIRFHVSGGEVHLHADAEKLKVAVPLASLSLVIDRIVSMTALKHTFYDGVNRAKADLWAGVDATGALDVRIELSAFIPPKSRGRVLTKLDALIARATK